MNASPSAQGALTLLECYRLLGLDGPVGDEALKTAFRKAVKAARPDMPGGDAERFRRVIAAARLIQASVPAHPALAAPRATTARPAPLPAVGLTPLQAVAGGTVEVRLGGRRLRVCTPAGLRTGDHVRLRGGAADGGDLYLPVLIRVADGLTVIGDDIYMAAPVGRRILSEGGRLEIQTHAGARSAWITPGLSPSVRLRLRDLGLPARGKRAAGHLFVSLNPVEDAPSAAEHLLARFTKVWTPERLAA
ncbi:MAG: DnaJ C-terminal domain-containing protein [Brevundimonas sp.]|uniref:DnaJ C-terminal domain-containing protein n=1 Tax=Brevundimonas sp. TaxID=1871086 RepID=UPI00403444B2